MPMDGYRPLGKTASHASLPQLRIITPKANDNFSHAGSIRNKGIGNKESDAVES